MVGDNRVTLSHLSVMTSRWVPSDYITHNNGATYDTEKKKICIQYNSKKKSYQWLFRESSAKWIDSRKIFSDIIVIGTLLEVWIYDIRGDYEF